MAPASAHQSKREQKEAAKQAEAQMVNQNFIYAPQIIFVGDKDAPPKEKPAKRSTGKQPRQDLQVPNFYLYDPIKYERAGATIFEVHRQARQPVAGLSSQPPQL